MQQILQQTREQAMRTTLHTPIAVRELPQKVRQDLDLEDSRLVKLTIETVDEQEERNHVFDLLEGQLGTESSEEWIKNIKTSRTTSPLKAKFE